MIDFILCFCLQPLTAFKREDVRGNFIWVRLQTIVTGTEEVHCKRDPFYTGGTRDGRKIV